MQYTTQPEPEFLAKLLDGITTPRDEDTLTWLGHTWALIAWSHITEPADQVAGNLVGMLGASLALEMAITGNTEEIIDALNERGYMFPEANVQAGLKRWRPRWSMTLILETIKLARTKGMHVLTDWDEQWPEGFDRLGAEGPHVLWVRGDIDVLTKPAVAFVGARAATSYGEHVAIELATSSTSHVVVSGGAYGIDGSAHRGALAIGGKTIAYLAGGADRAYPAGHANLLERIVSTGGALVSETPPGSTPTRWRFLQRNRLIAAHAQATVVVEAGARSGSINTAGHAVTLGRPLGAVPGPITSAASVGCHKLLREFDAVCITSWDDVKKLLEVES